MKKIVDWINSHKIITVCLAFLLLVVQPFLVHLILKIPAPSPFFVREWDAGDIITYIAGFEAFIGTVFLGVVAVRQNDKANELNVIMQESNEKQRIFERQPCIMISNWDFEYVDSNYRDSNKNTIYSIYEFWSELDNGEHNFSRLRLTFVNASKVCAEISINSITMEVSKRITQKQRILFTINESRRLFNLIPTQKHDIEIVYDNNELDGCTMYQIQIIVEMSNNIGENFLELIRLSIDRESFLSIDGYSTILFDKTKFESSK